MTNAAAPGMTPWSYVANNVNLDFLDPGQFIQFSFTVTATDSQGAPATDTVTIRINGTDDRVTINGIGLQGGDETVDEDDLADGCLAECRSGTFNISAPDGFDDLSVGPNEAFRIDFVVDVREDSGVIGNLADDNHADGTGPGSDYAANRNHNFDSHYLTNGTGANFTTTGSGTTKVEIRALDDFDANTVVGDGTPDAIAEVTINFGGDTETVSANNAALVVGTRPFNVNFNDLVAGRVTVEGNLDGVQIAVRTADGYSSLEYAYVSGNNFAIGGFSTTVLDPGRPVAFSVPVELVDGDGDTAGSSLDITLAAAGTGLQDFGNSLAGVTATASAALGENIAGSNFADTLTGDAARNVLYGDAGNDILNGLAGGDLLLGGLGSDSFVFAPGSSGPLDVIGDYAKGAVGVGDEIDYSVALTIGGSAAAATNTQASINATTGVATFAAGSGVILDDALTDIAARFAAATDTAGEFALFQVNNADNFYMFISDGAVGVTDNDVVVELIGVTTIGSINLTGGDFTIIA